MRLFLVRHGDAHAGLTGPIAGVRGCRGLTELGREQAGRLRDVLAARTDLEVDALIASELPRAVETAHILAPGLGIDPTTITRHCDLCEVHVGAADGLDWSEYVERYGSFDMAAEPGREFSPGGDSWNSFHTRVDAAMTRLADEFANRTVMATCHAGVIIASLRNELGDGPDDRQRARLVPVNTSLTEWEYDGERWTLRSYNDAAHLR